MSNAYRFEKECNGENPYNYGGLEESIGLIFDNYYMALDMYRTIIKLNKKIEEVKLKAHQDLQKLRDDEDRWKRLGKMPKNFDAEEHQNRKDHLIEIRETDFDLFYNGTNVKTDPLGNLILRNMRTFKILEACDRKTRGIMGKSSKSLVKIICWPTLKLINIDLKLSKNESYKEKITIMKEKMEAVPNKVESFFTVS